MVIKLVHFCIFWLNIFTPLHSILSNTSPLTLITGKTIVYNQHYELEFGEYFQTREEDDSTMISRTVGTIALRPTVNIQGGYCFLRLRSSA